MVKSEIHGSFNYHKSLGPKAAAAQNYYITTTVFDYWYDVL